MCHACQTTQCTKARFTRADWEFLRPLLRKTRRERDARPDAYDVLYDMVGGRWGWAFATKLMRNVDGVPSYYKWTSHEKQMKFLQGCIDRKWGRK